MSALQTMMPEPTTSESNSSDCTRSNQRLSAILAAMIDARQQVKQGHWNVTGPNFIGLHRLFDQMAGELDATIDIVAERQRALGFVVRGSMRDVGKISSLIDFPVDSTRSENVLSHLIKIYRIIAAAVRDEIECFTESGDFGTADLFTDAVRQLDQHLYLMTSHLS